MFLFGLLAYLLYYAAQTSADILSSSTPCSPINPCTEGFFCNSVLESFGICESCGACNDCTSCGLSNAAEQDCQASCSGYTLCEDGSPLPDGNLFIPSVRRTCAEYETIYSSPAFSVPSEMCQTLQSVVGSFCGCQNPVASSKACRLCGGGTASSCINEEFILSTSSSSEACETARASFPDDVFDTCCASASTVPSTEPTITPTIEPTKSSALITTIAPTIIPSIAPSKTSTPTITSVPTTAPTITSPPTYLLPTIATSTIAQSNGPMVVPIPTYTSTVPTTVDSTEGPTVDAPMTTPTPPNILSTLAPTVIAPGLDDALNLGATTAPSITPLTIPKSVAQQTEESASTGNLHRTNTLLTAVNVGVAVWGFANFLRG